jgi:hypothetical protein
MDKLNKKGRRLIGIAAVLFGLFIIFSMWSRLMDGYKVAKLTDRVKTACVGRFLIELPQAMELSYSHTFITGFWLSSFTESNEAFLARVGAREEAINAEPNEGGDKNMEKVEEIARDGFSGKILTFGRTTVKGLKDRKPISYTNVALEGYVHSNGTTFTIKTDAIDPEQTNILGKIIEKLRVVAPDTVPSAPGFCFGAGMLIDPVPVEWTEGVAIFAGFREHPDLAMVFHTRAGLANTDNDPGRLVRDAKVDAAMPLWQRALIKKIRIGPRKISGIEGEEVVQRLGNQNFVNVYAFDWEVGGTNNDLFVPSMHLEMSTGHPVHAGAPPVPSFLSEAALVELWDAISSSIRVRPTSPVIPVNKEVLLQGASLGDWAAAGDICLETGWWQCNEGGNGVQVLGGQRQFLKKGQRMPQVLLLPPQTIWEKVRRLQTSYESKQPTAWTLIDRRGKARANLDISLAPAIARNGSTVDIGTDTSGASTKVGSFSRTGTACPASGWWRCQDSGAVDGTRWFAKGELLPAATFRIPQPTFQLRRNVEVFQRRSMWQLVRQATGLGDSKADA